MAARVRKLIKDTNKDYFFIIWDALFEHWEHMLEDSFGVMTEEMFKSLCEISVLVCSGLFSSVLFCSVLSCSIMFQFVL